MASHDVQFNASIASFAAFSGESGTAMMGRSHALCGLTFGATVAAVIDHAPPAVRLLAIPVAGGAALLPDIDTPHSRIARSLGLITEAISMGVAWLSMVVYHATRTHRDSPYDNGGHRRLTHTIPGCLLFGAIVVGAVFAHPIAGAVVLALLVALLAQGFRSVGAVLTAAGGFASWNVVSDHPEWLWLWPALVAVGAWVHCLGDTVTSSGTPMLWPLVRDGKRWGNVRTPINFVTNSPFEHGPVTWVLWAGFGVSMGFASGIAQMFISQAVV